MFFPMHKSKNTNARLYLINCCFGCLFSMHSCSCRSPHLSSHEIILSLSSSFFAGRSFPQVKRERTLLPQPASTLHFPSLPSSTYILNPAVRNRRMRAALRDGELFFFATLWNFFTVRVYHNLDFCTSTRKTVVACNF